MQGLLFIRDLAVVLLTAAAVGGLFRKLGISVVVGYLVAGMVVGPFTPFSLVSDVERIRTLSQLGLVFLMFFVGMGLSLSRIRRLGFPLVLTTAGTAWLVFHFVRLLAAALDWTPTAGLYLAAMLVVSSSAILTKTLSEAGLTHEKFARRALGMSLLEDVVAVVMLTLLTTRSDGASTDTDIHMARVLGLLGGFVALLVVVGLLIVPRFLRQVAKSSDRDLKVAAVAGVVMWISYLAASAGYSVALGAFLLGMIVGETSFRDRIERAFTGVEGMFSVIFFVSIGMLIDIRLLWAHAFLIVGVAFFALFIRVLCAGTALLATGSSLPAALRTGLAVTTIGEFSYIIAQTGVNKGVVPEYFYGLAVGVSVVTAFVTPLLLRHSEAFVETVDRRQPAVLRRTIGAYRTWLDAMMERLKGNNFWVLTRGRIGQVLVELLLFLGVLGFSPMLHSSLHGLQSDTGPAAPALGLVFWLFVFFVALALAVAVWRNIGAMGMIFACAVFRDGATTALRPVMEGGIRFLAAVGLIALGWIFFPLPLSGWWSGAVVVAAISLFLSLFWRRLVKWHSHFQYSMINVLGAEAERSPIHSGKSVREEEWGVDLVEATVPEAAVYSGKSLRDLALRNRFGATVVAVERQGFPLPNPNPDLALFPGDKLLILGGDTETGHARAFLEQNAATAGAGPSFSESGLETVVVPDRSPRLRQSLADLRIFTATGVQVLGLRRNGNTTLNPSATEILLPGDRLLILAAPGEYGAFCNWLRG